MDDKNSHPIRRLLPADLVPASHDGYYAESDWEIDNKLQIGMLDYWRILRRSKGSIVLMTLAGVLLGGLVTLWQTPVYRAKCSLEIKGVNQNFLNMKDTSPINDGGGYAALTDIETQLRIIQSDALVERTTEKLKSGKRSEEAPGADRFSSWKKVLNLPTPTPAAQRDAALRSAASNLTAKAGGQARIIDLTFDSTNPVLAAEFLNTLANEYIDQNMEAHWHMAQRTGEWLTRQLEDMRIKLERSEDQLQAYARQTGLLFTGDKENVAEKKLEQLQAALSTAHAERIDKQSRWEIASAASPETLPDLVKDPSLLEVTNKLSELRRQQASLAAVYQPGYSKVKRADAEIAELEKGLREKRKHIIEGIQHDFEGARRRESLLALDYEKQARLVTADGEKSIQYNILKREVESNRQLYEAMFQKVKESSILSAIRASNIRVIDTAKAPGVPYRPSAVLNGGIGLLSGLFFGIVFVVTRQRADRTLQEPGEAPLWLNIPERGIIPSVPRNGLRAAIYSGGRPKPLPLLTGAGSPVEERLGLVTWQRKPSLVAESFRSVVASLMFSGNNGSRPRVLVVTSANPREGKSAVTSNLAIALAEIKRRVLVIDADLRKPQQHETFQVANEKGLSSLLTEEPAGPAALDGLIQQTCVPRVFLLPSGPATQAAASLLYSTVFAELLEKFKAEFDMIIVDTPPMLMMPDARVIGQCADGVLLVLRAGKTTRDAAIAAHQRFAEDGTPVVGSILNDWNPGRGLGGYYGYSSNEYHKSYAAYTGPRK